MFSLNKKWLSAWHAYVTKRHLQQTPVMSDNAVTSSEREEYVHELSKRLIVGWEAKLLPDGRIYYVK